MSLRTSKQYLSGIIITRAKATSKDPVHLKGPSISLHWTHYSKLLSHFTFKRSCSSQRAIRQSTLDSLLKAAVTSHFQEILFISKGQPSVYTGLPTQSCCHISLSRDPDILKGSSISLHWTHYSKLLSHLTFKRSCSPQRANRQFTLDSLLKAVVTHHFQ